MKYKISGNVIRRLPRYLRHLDVLADAGIEKVSSGELGAQMGLTPSQIRQDLNCFGGFGQQGYGYNVLQLREGIQDALGVPERVGAILIGAGNLGNALLTNFRFSQCGVRLMAAFDTDPAKIGRKVNGTYIFSVDAVEEFAEDNNVDIAILTLPQAAADEAARRVVAAGIRGIWNFTGKDLCLDENEAVVENVHLSDSLLALRYYLRSEERDL